MVIVLYCIGVCEQSKVTPLHLACLGGYAEVVKLLMSNDRVDVMAVLEVRHDNNNDMGTVLCSK